MNRRSTVAHRSALMPASSARASSRYNQARANAQSFCAVRSEMPNVWAVSSIDSPPKKRSSTTRALRGSSAASLSSASSIATSPASGWAAARSMPSSGTRTAAGPPRRSARRRRAMSTSTRRIICDETPKKCPRFCHRTPSHPISRRHTSLTRAVACIEKPERSPARHRSAMRWSSS